MPTENVLPYAHKRRPRTARRVVAWSLVGVGVGLAVWGVFRQVAQLAARPSVGPVDWDAVATQPALWKAAIDVATSDDVCAKVRDAGFHNEYAYDAPVVGSLLGGDPRVVLKVVTPLSWQSFGLALGLAERRHLAAGGQISDGTLEIRLGITNQAAHPIVVPPIGGLVPGMNPLIRLNPDTADWLEYAHDSPDCMVFTPILAKGVEVLAPGCSTVRTFKIRAPGAPATLHFMIAMYGAREEVLIIIPRDENGEPMYKRWSDVPPEAILQARFGQGLPVPPSRVKEMLDASDRGRGG